MAAAVELAEVDLHSSEKTATEACAVPAADVQAEVEVSTAAVAHSLPVGPDGEPVTWIEKKGQAFENWMNEDWPHVPLFWEKEYTGPSPEELGWKGRLWHRTRGVVNKSLSGAEFVGEVMVNMLGLNESKYQWVIDSMEREEEQKKQRALEDSQRRMLREQAREARAAAAAEAEGEQLETGAGTEGGGFEETDEGGGDASS